jgi:ligand-binding sensor domain-containing protein
VSAQLPVRFQNLTVNEGLSMGTITAFEKDAVGYTWIGTAEGLHRYDGKYFKIFKHIEGSNNSLTDSYITSLESVDNKLYIGNNIGNIDIMDMNDYSISSIMFTSIDPSFDFPISSLKTFKNHLVIATKGGGGLWLYNLKTKILSKLMATENDKLDITGLAINNDYFYASTPRDVFRLDLNNYKKLMTHEDGQITSIGIVNDNILLGTEHGLFKYNTLFNETTAVQLPERRRLVYFITSILINDDATWVGTKGGLLRFDDSTTSLYKKNALRPYYLVNDQVSTLFSDDNNILWVGTISGVSRYAPQLSKFGLLQHFDFQGKNYNNNVYYTYEDRSKHIWLGTLTSGLIRLDENHNIDRVYPSLVSGQYETRSVRCIYEDRNGIFWIGTRDEGLFQLNPETGEAKLIANRANRKIESNVIRTIYEDDNGILWIGTQVGIYYIDSANQFVKCKGEENSRNNSIYQIEKHPKTNELIAGSFRGGIQLYNPETESFRFFKHNALDSTSLSNNNVMSLEWVNNDTLLVGTYGGGLNIFDLNTEKFSHISEKDGLINNAVYGIIYEGDGKCWLSTNNGLVQYSIYDHTFINFRPEHYLQSTEYNEGAFLESSKGYYYFGGVNGLNFFKPSEIQYDQLPAPLYFTDIRGEFTSKKENRISLSFINSRLEIDFMALYYPNPNGVKYKYKMIGYDNNWIESNISNTAIYPRLSPGTYTFSVIAEDEFGNWESISKDLRIRVEPPFWQKWWFIILIIGTVLGLLYAIFKYRTREIERLYKLQLVDSELAALRSQMNPHFIFNSLNSIQYFILKKEPKEAYTYLSKFASLMRKILQNSRLKYISVKDEVEWLNLYLEMEKMRMDNNLEYSITSENIEDEEHTYIPTMLIQPFVENSIIHGLLPKDEDRHLNVVIKKEEDHLLCTISDNGIGRAASRIMNAKRSSKHASAGMDLTRKRLAILSEGKGNFDVQFIDLEEDGEGTGTVAKILAPIFNQTD